MIYQISLNKRFDQLTHLEVQVFGISKSAFPVCSVIVLALAILLVASLAGRISSRKAHRVE